MTIPSRSDSFLGGGAGGSHLRGSYSPVEGKLVTGNGRGYYSAYGNLGRGRAEFISTSKPTKMVSSSPCINITPIFAITIPSQEMSCKDTALSKGFHVYSPADSMKVDLE